MCLVDLVEPPGAKKVSLGATKQSLGASLAPPGATRRWASVPGSKTWLKPKKSEGFLNCSSGQLETSWSLFHYPPMIRLTILSDPKLAAAKRPDVEIDAGQVKRGFKGQCHH